MEQKYSNTLISSRKDGKLAYTKHLFDIPKDKSQEDINKEFYAAMTKLADSFVQLNNKTDKAIDTHKADIKTLDDKIEKRTQAITTDKIAELAKQYLD